jgi:RNA polymerase sigma factor (sigma-70 family)
MPASQMSKVLLYLRGIRAAEENPSDFQLLDRFFKDRDESAFETLVRRHGSMVLGVCRRILKNDHDAEDAFQATFLVLVCKASAISKRETVGGFLYGVAYKTALKARAANDRRRDKERQAGTMQRRESLDEDIGQKLQALLDQEMSRLPDKYRVPIVLCDLEGKTRKAAANQLGWPEGTLSGRLSRGRTLLAKRLKRHNLSLSSGTIALGLPLNGAPACVSQTLVTSTVKAAACVPAGHAALTGAISARVAALMDGVLKSMLLTKLKIAATVSVLMAVLSGGLLAPLVFSDPPAERDRASAPSEPLGPLTQSKKPRVLTDHYGDPLPPNALLRLGTVRMRTRAFQLVFLPGQKQLVSVSGERINVGQVWDISTGRAVRRLEMGIGFLAGSAFTPDGKTAALAYTDQKTASLVFVDTLTGKQVHRKDMPTLKVIGSLAFSPDGRTLAGWCDDETIRLWEVATGREIRRMTGRQAKVTELTISPDGQTLASGGHDFTIRLWDVKTGAERHKLEGFAGQIFSLAFAPDGATLASTGRNDKSIRLWDVKTGTLRQRIEGHQAPPHLAAFSPDGKLLASFEASDHSIRLWDAATGRPLRRIDGGSNYMGVLCLLFSSDSKTLVAGGNSFTIRLWNLDSGEEIRPRGEHQSRVSSVAYSPDGKTLASGNLDSTIRLWDVSTGALLQRIQKHKEVQARAVFSPDGTILALTGGDGFVRLLDRSSGKELRQFDVSKGPSRFAVSLVAFSPDGKIVATAGKDSAVRLWSVRTGKPLLRIDRPADIHRIAFSPDGRFLATGESTRMQVFGNGSVHLWETATGREVRHWSPESRYIESLTFSPDGSALAASGAFSSPIYIWDVASGEQRMLLEIKQTEQPGIRRKPRALAVAFSPDGKTLAASNEIDHLIYLWETLTGKERSRLVGHQGAVWSLAFSPDGLRLASGSDDTTVLVWDASGLPAGARTGRLSAEQVQALWANLASNDASKAFESIGLLTASPEQAIPLLKSKLRPAPTATDRQDVARLIADLDSAKFAAREKAMEQLRQLGERAEPALTEYLKNKPGLEVRKRIEDLLERVRSLSIFPERLRELRAIEALEHIGTADARQVLKALAEGAAHARLTREAKAALERLAKRRLVLSGQS